MRKNVSPFRPQTSEQSKVQTKIDENEQPTSIQNADSVKLGESNADLKQEPSFVHSSPILKLTDESSKKQSYSAFKQLKGVVADETPKAPVLSQQDIHKNTSFPISDV